MDSAEIPDDIRRFLLQHIDSVAKLEGLLLMYRHQQQDWDAAFLASRLYINSQQAGAILSELGKIGLCRATEPKGNIYRYSPANEGLSDVVARLEGLYAKHLIPITNLIHSRGPSSLQHFADAFKMFKKEDS